jgi:PAS domain S-box-containing protein
MQEKTAYINDQISSRVQYWISKMLLLGIVFFPVIGIADYFLTPENLKRFTLYRAAVTIALAAAYFLNKAKRSITFQYTIITVSTLLSALVIELMILQFGGHASPYYAGLCLLIIAALGLIPYGFFLSLSVGIAIYLIYLLPILFLDTITMPAVFIMNNIFMICTFVLALSWRTLSRKIMVNELSLQYDLLQDKAKLEQAVMALNKSERWHRSLFETATEGIIVLDRNGTIVSANRSACKMHGMQEQELVGRPLGSLAAEGGEKGLRERMQRLLNGESLVFETVHKKKDGTSFPVEVSSQSIVIGDALYIQSFYRDISEKNRLQEHLLQSQKMESIGVLAGGIAHDFNNTLNIILGHTAIAQSSEGLDARTVKSLGVIESTAIKAGHMISKLLGFARKKTYEFLPLDLNEVVYDTVKMLEQVVGRTVRLAVDLDAKLPLIRADVNQMEQIIMNFVVNARDALPERKGSIVVKTAYREIASGMPGVPPYIPSGPYVLLSVSDTGAGIPEDIRNSIFEPFFTTKERGKGTGLGLSMVYGAVKKHNGYIDLKSIMDEGSVFTVYLPAITVTKRSESPVADLSGNETLLVVDDEESILSAMEDILSHRGYTAITAKDGEAALGVFREHRGIALVITDIVMPRLDGRELIKRMKEIRPETKIVAVSGYTNYVAEKEEIRNIDGFLQKPFEASSLLSTVRHILDSESKELVSP